jgi:hypothetical protein
VAELGALPRPEADEERLGRIWGLAGRSAALGKEAAEALRREDQVRLRRASTRGAVAQTRFNKRAIAYGFLVCGRGTATE